LNTGRKSDIQRCSDFISESGLSHDLVMQIERKKEINERVAQARQDILSGQQRKKKEEMFTLLLSKIKILFIQRFSYNFRDLVNKIVVDS